MKTVRERPSSNFNRLGLVLEKKKRERDDWKRESNWF